MQIRKFANIYSYTSTLSNTSKGNFFEIFTYNMFKYDSRLNHSLQEIWLQRDIPKEILPKLKLPHTDKGIDILRKSMANIIRIPN